MLLPYSRQLEAGQYVQAGSLENERSRVDRTVQDGATGFKNSDNESF